jgi:hypothetical protein
MSNNPRELSIIFASWRSYKHVHQAKAKLVLDYKHFIGTNRINVEDQFLYLAKGVICRKGLIFANRKCKTPAHVTVAKRMIKAAQTDKSTNSSSCCRKTQL